MNLLDLFSVCTAEGNGEIDKKIAGWNIKMTYFLGNKIALYTLVGKRNHTDGDV